MPQSGFGKRVQSAIYRAGLFGKRPVVPTDGARLEERARDAMSQRAHAFVVGSAGSENTARENRAAFDEWSIVPQMLVDTDERDLSVELFGRRHDLPLLVAPLGVTSLVDPQADVAVAGAARTMGLTQILSTQASVPMEEVARRHTAAGSAPVGHHWFQLYWSRNEDLTRSLVDRAEAIGTEAIVVTLDTAHLGWRPRDLDLGHLPFGRGEGIAQYTSDPVFRDLVARRIASGTSDSGDRPRPTPAAIRTLVSMSRNHPGDTRHNLTAPEPRAAVETFLDIFANPALTWDGLGALREMTDLPIILKGILSAQDAVRAVDAGVDGVYVSNHGGRQADRVVASLTALPEVVEALADRPGADGRPLPVIFDSGVRTGADVYVALALGADAVAIGRPYVYGLAIAGERGATEVLRNIAAELDLTMALTGATSIAEVTRERLRRTR